MEDVVPQRLLDQWMEAMTTPALVTPDLDDPNPPDWLDKDRFRRGQSFFWRHYAAISISGIVGSAGSFAMTSVFQVLLFANKFGSVSNCLKRVMDTAKYLGQWMGGDMWDPKDPSYQGMAEVQKMHQRVGTVTNRNKEKVRASRLGVNNEPGLYQQCRLWSMARQDVQCSREPYPYPDGALYMSQFDVLSVGVGALMVLACPERFGIHATHQELEDYVYVWRVVIYYLGVQDRYNPCTGLDTFRSYQQHYNTTFILPAYRHMSKEDEFVSRLHTAAMHKMAPVTVLLTGDVTLAYVLWVLGCDTGTVQGAMSWYNRTVLAAMKFIMLVLMKLSVVRSMANYMAKSFTL